MSATARKALDPRLRTALPQEGPICRSVGAYSEAEALTVIDAIVTGYVSEMAVQHERIKYPSVRMPGKTPVNDPMRDEPPPLEENPFADMISDQPWEATR